MKYASNIPRRLKNVLAKIFTNPRKICESLNRFIVSNENVEKVVNPPQNPIVKNIFNWALISSL